jgi:hypothetical protein
LWAQPPEIDIELVFDKPSRYFAFGEPIAVEALVRNESGMDIWISKGFTTRVFFRQLRIIDPAGRMLLPTLNLPSPAPPDAESTADQFPIEAPDAPPYPWRHVGDRVVRVGFCEVLAEGWTSEGWQHRAEDLREYYDISLPGYYSAQVQVPAKVFKNGVCELEDYEWQGQIKSEMAYFYVEGATEVNVLPALWRIVWQDGIYVLPNMKVAIWPPDGLTVDAYREDSIRLNNVPANEVVRLYSFLKKQHYLLAFFNKQDAINSLGEVQVGQWHSVELSGRTTRGAFFGGAQRIRIVR